MAVEAPSLSSQPADIAQVPHAPIATDGKAPNSNGRNRKRPASPVANDANGASKRAKPNPAKPALGKKRNVVESSDEDDGGDGDVDMDASNQDIAQKPTPINPDASGRVNSNGANHPHIAAQHPKATPPPVDQGSDSSDDDAPLSKSTPQEHSTVPSAPVLKPKSNGKASSSRSAASSKQKTTAPPPESASSDDDKPLAKKVSAKKPTAKTSARAAKKTSAKSKHDDDSSVLSDESQNEESDPYSDSDDDDKPLAKKGPAKKSSGARTDKKAVSKGKAIASSAKGKAKNTNETSAGAKPSKAAVSKGKQSKVKKEESSDDDTPLTKKVKSEEEEQKPKVRAGKKKAGSEQAGNEDEEDLFKWWEADNNDGSAKWTSLAHNGVFFPPPYVPLPKDIKMKYNGVSLTLKPHAEEVAGFFGALLESDHAADKKFQENFFKDWLKVLKDEPPAENIQVTDFKKCDFRPMFEYFELQKEKKKQLTAAQKKQIKAERDEIEKPYLFATVDGRKEKLGNFRVEPPGLFRGRGEHPKKGTYKYRLSPSDIVINIGKDAPVPVPNIPGEWKEVVHDNTVTWLAHWKENVNGNSKYVFLSAGSTWKGQSDRQKFEKARKLQEHIDVIRKDYTAELKSKVMAERQRATAMYLIDRLALRAGNEKGEDEADTVGCCSLRLEHVTLIPPSTVELRFLGKDSIMYEQEVAVDPQVFKNIKIFKAAPKGAEDDLFDRLNTTQLNKHLGNYMEGLSAKVFRTYNASWTFQQQLRALTPKKGTVAEKIAAYNKANKEVAILCNHQKTVSKAHGTSMEKLGDKLFGIKYQRMRLRYSLFTLDPKLKKKHPELVEDESDLDDDACERHEKSVLENNIDKAKKKFEKENLKLQGDGEKPQKPSVLEERLAAIEEDHETMVSERKSRKIEVTAKGTDADKLIANIQKLDDRIGTAKVSIEDRESNKTVALGTSKINYIDPRLTVAWAKKHDVPLEKLFSKTLIQKFPWAIAEVEAEPDWTF